MIISHRTAEERQNALEKEIERVGYVSLTEAYLNLNSGGTIMLEWLGKDETANMRVGTARKFKIRAHHNEWGEEYKPGDIIVRKVQKPLRDKGGRKLRNNAVMDLKRRGLFEKEFVETRTFNVDEKGCIEAYFEDAGWFISEYGFHWDGGGAICGRREMSREPCKAPDGSLKHVRYWRFSEAPPEIYKTLPNLKKKGRPKKQKEETNDNPPITAAED
jgi:hypothetical protein